MKSDVARVRPQPHMLQQRTEPDAFPLADAAPAFDAIVARDLGARRQGAQLAERELRRSLDQAADLELPIDEPAARVRLIQLIGAVIAAVDPEQPRNVLL